jgi:hypothetical protein
MYAPSAAIQTHRSSQLTGDRVSLLRVRVEYLTIGTQSCTGETLNAEHAVLVADEAIAMLAGGTFELGWALDNPYKATRAAATNLGYL